MHFFSSPSIEVGPFFDWFQAFSNRTLHPGIYSSWLNGSCQSEQGHRVSEHPMTQHGIVTTWKVLRGAAEKSLKTKAEI